MYQIKRVLKDFCAAHRLIKGYVGKCQHLHGHNYQIQVTLAASQLDEYGFVADFSDVKAICDNWVQANWDHVTLVQEDDDVLLRFLREQNMRHYVLCDYPNTTAECLSACLYGILQPMVAKLGVELIAVEIAETNRCRAMYQP